MFSNSKLNKESKNVIKIIVASIEKKLAKIRHGKNFSKYSKKANGSFSIIPLSKWLKISHSD